MNFIETEEYFFDIEKIQYAKKVSETVLEIYFANAKPMIVSGAEGKKLKEMIVKQSHPLDA